MKRHLSIIVFILIAISCNGQLQKLIVKTDSHSKEIRYWALNGKQLPYYDLSAIANIYPEEATEISLPQEDNLYNVLIGEKMFKIYSTAGSIDTIYLYNDSLSFGGDNKNYNDLLVRTEKSDTYCRDYSRRREHQLTEINNLSEFYKIIDSLKTSDNLFLRNGEFSEQFVKQQKLFTEMRYNALFLKKISSLYRTPDFLTDEWMDELKNKDFLFTNELSQQSEWFYDILKDYVFSQSLIIEKKSPQDIMDSYNEFLFSNYCKTLGGQNLEYALACLFYDDIFQDEYSKEIPALYNRFISLFPSSPYAEVLTPGIKKIEELYSRTDDDQVLMVNYETEPKSIKEMIHPFSGKVVYIDIWATWCSPCIKMFSHLDNLKEKVSEIGGVVFLYISLDQDRSHEKWKKMTNYYNLNGYHYRVNEQTSKILHSSLGDSKGILTIPRYIIVDKNGEIAFANAASPSEPDKVVEQIRTLLK